jgi:hypothetical protein
MPYLVRKVSNFLSRVVDVSPGLFLCVVVLGRALRLMGRYLHIYGVSNLKAMGPTGACRQILITSSQEGQTTPFLTVLS